MCRRGWGSDGYRAGFSQIRAMAGREERARISGPLRSPLPLRARSDGGRNSRQAGSGLACRFPAARAGTPPAGQPAAGFWLGKIFPFPYRRLRLADVPGITQVNLRGVSIPPGYPPAGKPGNVTRPAEKTAGRVLIKVRNEFRESGPAHVRRLLQRDQS